MPLSTHFVFRNLNMHSRTVHSDRVASYADPIAVCKGEKFQLIGRKDVWDGHIWVWATATDGREGWVPDDLIQALDGQFVAASDYSAMELTCKAGDIVNIVREDHGWAWCRTEKNGLQGWLPLRSLE